MGKQVDKNQLYELIRLTKKYWKTGDIDILPARSKQAERLENYTGIRWSIWTDIIDGINSYNSNMPYEKFYEVFKTIGIEIVDEKEELE